MSAQRTPPVTPERHRQLNHLTIIKANAQLLARVPWQMPDAQRIRLLRGLAAIDGSITDLTHELALPREDAA